MREEWRKGLPYEVRTKREGARLAERGAPGGKLGGWKIPEKRGVERDVDRLTACGGSWITGGKDTTTS